jgi:hypothetical protein
MNSGATAPEWVDSPATYNVNTFYAELGGYVIEVRDGGKHGLVVAMQNLLIDPIVAPYVSQNFFNLMNLINDPYYHDVNGDKFMDWRLPTKRELNLMYVHYSGGNALGLLGASYLSSTEFDTSQYWYHNFLNGNQEKGSQTTASHVRVVRVF